MSSVSRSRRSPLALVLLFASIALVALLVYGVVSAGDDHSIEDAISKGKGKPAPALTLPSLNGEGEVSLAKFRGDVVVVNFWASWCDPCKREAPALESFWRKHREDGIKVVGVDVQDVRADGLAFARRYGLSFPLARDRDREAGEAWGLTGLPETFVVDGEGRIVAVHRGPIDARILDELLERAGGGDAR